MDKKKMTAGKLLERHFMAKKGEAIVITLDTLSNMEAAELIAEAGHKMGLKVITVNMPAPTGVGMEVDGQIAGECIKGALNQADIWIELNKKWIFGSSTYSNIMGMNRKLRHMCLTGADMLLLENCIGEVNYDVLIPFANRLVDIIKDANTMRMTTKMGMDISFKNVKGRAVTCELGSANVPGSFMLPGQIAWTPDIDTIQGKLVFDGALAPVCGVPKKPVKIEIVNGKVNSVTGGEEAAKYKNWLESFGHPQMLRISHTGLGLNPGAILSGDVIQDQRVWGSATWAFGSIGSNLVEKAVDAPSHSDCVSLGITLYIDGRTIFEDGEVVDSELSEIVRKIK
ncbi:MAG TPA: aminopeptidase [Sedimentibacter sp.]|nr:aminopeptidase [Sedimentibacter sp.]HQK53190.1 aminopeptidase [Sedimentibacter sp.]